MKRVRAFDWRDIPALHRSRQHCTFLNSAQVLTRGPMLMSGALLSYLAPSMGVYTSVSLNGDQPQVPLIGQMNHLPGAQCAHLSFLTPDYALEAGRLSGLLEHFMSISGERGAYRLLAEVEEQTRAYESLRLASFAVYTRQRIWRLNTLPPPVENGGGWRAVNDQDWIAVRSLYNNLVPGLVQQVEPFASQGPRGLLHCSEDGVQAYVELKYGHRGIWVQPFVHPDAPDVEAWLADLFQHLPYRRSRPVYVCIRSYQSWLETAVSELGAEPGPGQAVMVKHLAVPQKAARIFALPALERGRPEVSTPIARTGVNRVYGPAENNR